MSKVSQVIQLLSAAKQTITDIVTDADDLHGALGKYCELYQAVDYALQYAFRLIGEGVNHE